MFSSRSLGCIGAQPFEPSEFVVEFRSGIGVAVRGIKTADQYSIDNCFDVAALVVFCCRLAVPVW